MTETVKPTHVPAAHSKTPNATEFSEIPIIDLAPMFCNDTEAKKEMAEKLREACVEVGFFYIKNHEIPESHMLGVRKQTANFYKNSKKDK